MYLTDVEQRVNNWIFLKQLRQSIKFMEESMHIRDYSIALKKEKDLYKKELPKALVA